jgi:hypothetical protein
MQYSSEYGLSSDALGLRRMALRLHLKSYWRSGGPAEHYPSSVWLPGVGISSHAVPDFLSEADVATALARALSFDQLDTFLTCCFLFFFVCRREPA